MRNYKGFALAELLIVIGIILILTAMLTPAAMQARDKAYQGVCMSNLKQIGMAAMAASMDNGNVFPCPSTLLGKGGMFMCPSDPQRFTTKLSYAENGLLPGLNQSAVCDTSNTVLALDAVGNDGWFHIGQAAIDAPGTAIQAMSSNYPADSLTSPMNAVHDGRADVLFVDGHVHSEGVGELTVSMFVPR